MRRASVEFSGGSAKRAVLEDLDQLAAGAEQQHRAELRIEAAAEDQLVAVELDHGLHRDALEVLGASLFRDRLLDGLERRLHRCRIAQVQLHAADIGLVRDGVRVQLQHDRDSRSPPPPAALPASVIAMRVSTVGMS